MATLVRIPTRRTHLHRDKLVDVDQSAATKTVTHELGSLRATYAVRIPLWLARLLTRWEDRRIDAAETRSDEAIYNVIRAS